jgi:hypothetical protein
MARHIRLTPYDEPYGEQIVGAFDDGASGPESMVYGPAPSMTRDGYPLAEDPMPLFLSGDDEEPRRRGFGTGREARRGTPVVPRILKAGIYAALAAAIAFAIVSVENPLAVFANAKASLIGSADSSGAAPAPSRPVAAVRLVSNNPAATVAQSAPSVPVLSPAARVTPTRDDIALALRAAHQSLPEAAPPQTAAAPVRRLDPDELANLLTRAKGLIAVGDIAPARLLLERAAEAQEASAALLLAQTYDPAVLGTQDMRSITPDPAKARDWYQKAARFGSLDAKQRLAQMQN